MFERIQFADNSIGISGVYQLPINPTALDPADSTATTKVDCLVSAPVLYDHEYDGRTFSMVWNGLPADNTTYSGMIDTLTSYRGEEKYINWNSIADLQRITASGAGWHGPFTIENVELSVRSGGGKIYESVKVSFFRSV